MLSVCNSISNPRSTVATGLGTMEIGKLEGVCFSDPDLHPRRLRLQTP